MRCSEKQILLYTFGQGAFHPMSLVIVLRVRIGSLWDPYRIPMLPSCALWSQVCCMHPRWCSEKRQFNGQIVQPAVPGRKFRRKFSTGDKKAMAFFGKFVRCRSNDMLKLWRVLTNEQMGVEMPMKWHERINARLTNKFRARRGLRVDMCSTLTLGVWPPWKCSTKTVCKKRGVKTLVVLTRPMPGKCHRKMLKNVQWECKKCMNPNCKILRYAKYIKILRTISTVFLQKKRHRYIRWSPEISVSFFHRLMMFIDCPEDNRSGGFISSQRREGLSPRRAKLYSIKYIISIWIIYCTILQ